MEKLEWLMNYMGNKLEELATEEFQEFSVVERAFLRANTVLMKYDEELALLYSNEYVEIANSKIESYLAKG